MRHKILVFVAISLSLPYAGCFSTSSSEPAEDSGIPASLTSPTQTTEDSGTSTPPPAVDAVLPPTEYAAQELQRTVLEVAEEDPTYQIDATDVAALAEQEDLDPAVLAAVRSVSAPASTH